MSLQTWKWVCMFALWIKTPVGVVWREPGRRCRHPSSLQLSTEVAAFLSLRSVFEVFACLRVSPESERSAVDWSGLESEPDPHNAAAARRRLKTHKSSNHEELNRSLNSSSSSSSSTSHLSWPSDPETPVAPPPRCDWQILRPLIVPPPTDGGLQLKPNHRRPGRRLQHDTVENLTTNPRSNNRQSHLSMLTI